jgi:hypothetical protein
MIDKDAKDGTLVQQIDNLYNQRIITEDIKELAHEIRIWGNVGAHPRDDELESIDAADVKDTKELLEALFDYIYVMPHKVKLSRSRRQNRK